MKLSHSATLCCVLSQSVVVAIEEGQIRALKLVLGLGVNKRDAGVQGVSGVPWMISLPGTVYCPDMIGLVCTSSARNRREQSGYRPRFVALYSSSCTARNRDNDNMADNTAVAPLSPLAHVREYGQEPDNLIKHVRRGSGEVNPPPFTGYLLCVSPSTATDGVSSCCRK